MIHSGYAPQIERELHMHTTKIIHDTVVREGLFPGEDEFAASFLDSWEMCPMSKDWTVHNVGTDEIEFVPAGKSIKVPI